MRLFLIVAMVFASASTSVNAQISIPETVKVKTGRLARIEAKCETAVKWINLSDDLDLIPDSSGRWAFLQSQIPGKYRIAAYTASKEGIPSDPVFCLIIVEGSSVPPPTIPPPAKPKPNVEMSIVKIRFGNSGCTATIVGPRRSDGRWDVLTAAHCTGPKGSKGTISSAAGRTIPLTVAVRDTTCDISWMVADTTDADLPFALLADDNPSVGTSVWHKGYGVDRPGNLEQGEVSSGQDQNGQIRFNLSVSSGDSGSGIFRSDTNEIVGVVCCTASMAKKGAMWGGSSKRARELRPSQTVDFFHGQTVLPHPIPIRQFESRLMPFAWLDDSLR